MHVIGVAVSGRTLGKWCLRIRVVSCDGGPVRWWRSVLRFAIAYPLFVLLVPFSCYAIVANVPAPLFQPVSHLALTLQILVLLISMVMLWRHPQRCTLPDLVVATRVVRLR